MQKVNLTDQELNEWVSDRIMGWRNGRAPMINMFNIAECEEFDAPYASYPFLPCKLLDHAHLMEEKIREMGEKVEPLPIINWKKEYGKNLTLKILGSENTDLLKILNLSDLFDLAHASARQRCEAAYLTFNKGD